MVDDDQNVLKMSALVLTSAGYEVRTAEDGFAALAELRRSLPDVIISDLRMPNMSGFELLAAVRRRFPQILTIATSGEYHGNMPSGVIADAFFTKGQYSPDELLKRIAELLENPPPRPILKPDKAPVWVPRNETGYFILTCIECLRSFSVPNEEARLDDEVLHTRCTFCDATIPYRTDVQLIRKNLPPV